MTTSPVMTVTDELLAELEALSVTSASASGGEDWISELDISGALANECDIAFVVKMSPSTTQALVTELRTLRAGNAKLRKDAGRYQWLRNQSMEYRQNGPAAIMAEVSGEKGTFLELDDLDAAIDAAMQADQ